MMSQGVKKKRTQRTKLSQSGDNIRPSTSCRLQSPQSETSSRRRKRKRGGDGGQMDESTETPVNERPLGLRSPTEKSSPYMIMELKDAVFGRFENVRIFVNSDELIPSRVWFTARDGAEDETPVTPPSEGKHYEVVQVLSDWKSSVGQYLPKWTKEREGEGMRKMSTLFEEVGKILRWCESSLSWVPCAERTQSEESDNCASTGSSYHAGLSCLLEYMFDVQYFCLALKQNMVDYEGRRAVYMLVQCACAIIFGPDFTKKKKVGIYCVGSSNAFPVEVVHNDGRWSLDMRSVPEDGNVSNVSGTGSVVADIVVASGHKPDWPRFLLVGGIKRERLNQKYMSQLVREMAAPLMHQSDIFGLLINDQEAKIVHLQHKFEEKIITMKTSGYSFIDHTVPEFSISEMNRFFVDLVAVLDYGKNEIKEIYHGF